MHKISPLIGPLRATPPIIGSEEERARREYTVQMSKRALIDLCQQEASKFLVQGCYDLAIPGALQVTSLCALPFFVAGMKTMRGLRPIYVSKTCKQMSRDKDKQDVKVVVSTILPRVLK